MPPKYNQVGGCGSKARGDAAMSREFGRGRVKGSEARRTANKVVHCPSPMTNCGTTKKMYKANKTKK